MRDRTSLYSRNISRKHFYTLSNQHHPVCDVKQCKMASRKTSMSDCRTAHFIELFRDTPCMWDTRDPQYFDRSIAREAVLGIARAMDMTEEDVRKKIRGLRIQYTANLRAYQGSRASGSSTADVKTPSWKFFQLLDFLRPCVTLRPGKDNLSQQMSAQQEAYNTPPVDDSCLTASQQIVAIEPSGDLQDLMQQVGDTRRRLIPATVQNTDDDNDFHRPLSAPAALLSPLPSRSGPQELSPDDSCFLRVPLQHRQSTVPNQQSRPSTTRRALALEVRETYHPPTAKRRKSDTTEEAMSVLQSIANRRTTPETNAENDFFFRMIAHKVANFPLEYQDDIRQHIYSFVLDKWKQIPGRMEREN